MAVPVASRVAYERLSRKVNEIVCVAMPEPFFAVGQWFRDFSAVTDRDAIATLQNYNRFRGKEIATNQRT